MVLRERQSPALHCPVGGSPALRCPSLGVTVERKTTTKAMIAGEDLGFLARRFVLEFSLGEIIATATPVGGTFLCWGRRVPCLPL